MHKAFEAQCVDADNCAKLVITERDNAKEMETKLEQAETKNR
jgi:hypothetical protein